jgi:predicted ester cyclase
MSTENQAKARRAYDEGWNKGNLSVFDELLAEDFGYHDANHPDVRTKAEYKQFADTNRGFWSGVYLTIEDMLAEGEQVAARGTMGGSWHGEFWGVQVGGKPATWTWTSIFRFRDGRIVDIWNDYQSLGIPIQLGVISPPTPRKA